MSNSYLVEVDKLERLREAWIPAVEFLFGSPVENIVFDGFEVLDDLSRPTTLLSQENGLIHYKIQMPAKSFSNDVMLLADVIQEMVRALFPVVNEQDKTTALCEGVAVFGAITAIKQVFGEGTVDSYLNALREQAFSYYDAFSYVALLLAEDPQAIKKLRKEKPYLYEVERDDFSEVGIDIDRKMKDILLLSFRA
ncbi:hypothetical protein OFY17_13360 [Marinomonas sp. C2222]|uniref:Uncharacterized protein n=1 Tax=Marinomonas sargassi TaxID=2984494 RepID=A0ABT2YVD0_9GAMM|nr:hypothetical protein [Marinomonas sargassi]MCV2403854.1 hypothetical protein [Marinomonas sargassi]